MRNTILATLIAMLFCMSLVSCDKDDEPKQVLYADTLVNDLPFNIELNVGQQFFYLKPSEKVDCYKLVTEVNGVPMFNADFAYKGGEYQNKDSMIVVKDYPFIPIKKAFEHANSIDSVKYYTFTEEVFRDIIAKMKAQGIEPTKYDYDYFSHRGKVFGYYNFKNASSFDISFPGALPTAIACKDVANFPLNDCNVFICDGKNARYEWFMNCSLNYTDGKSSYSLEISGFEWEIADYKSFKEDLNTTDTFYFVFTDKLLESMKSFMAEKGVLPVETEFPKE